MIPNALMNNNLRFCRIKKGTKKPFEKDWVNKPYTFEEINKYVENEINYGVLCGYGGLIVIDADTKELKEAIEKNLPSSLIVKTGSSGVHFYYICNEVKKKIVLQREDKHYGEVQSYGTQVVGPGSIHPNGNRYEIISDKQIAEITNEQLLLAITPFMKEIVEEEIKVLGELRNYGDADINSISILSVINTSGFKKASNGEYYGSNPWHGSEGGMNFWINSLKNVAHCFRCNCGVNVARAIALNEGIIKSCDDIISKSQFLEVLDIARKKYGLKELKKEMPNITEKNYQIRLEVGGGIVPELELVYAPLGDYEYAYNLKGDKGVTRADILRDEKGKPLSKYIIKFGNKTFEFKGKPLRELVYDTVDEETIFEWMKESKINAHELYTEIKSKIQKYADLIRPEDADILTMFVFESWLSDLLKGLFYIEIKSRMGAGKTTILEILRGLCKNSMLLADISYAAIPRVIEEYKITCLIDEIDQIPRSERYEIFKILRAGYRKENMYTRLKPKTFEVIKFSTFGAKAFNYRSEIPEDLSARSIPINLEKSDDKGLPIINPQKNNDLKQTYNEIWKFYMDIFQNTKINEVVKTFDNIGLSGEQESLLEEESDNIERRLMVNKVLNNALSFITSLKEEGIKKQIINSLKNISGRNIELFFVIINLCSFFDFDVFFDFVKIFEEKEMNEQYDVGDIKGILKEILVQEYPTAKDLNGLKYHTHKHIATTFGKKTHEEFGIKTSSHQFKQYLRELGFIDGVSRRIIRDKESNKASLCLVYTTKIKKNLELIDERESKQVKINRILNELKGKLFLSEIEFENKLITEMEINPEEANKIINELNLAGLIIKPTRGEIKIL